MLSTIFLATTLLLDPARAGLGLQVKTRICSHATQTDCEHRVRRCGSSDPLGPKQVPHAYIGCFVDDGHRDLQEGPMQYGYDPASCAAACNGYKYFALQNGGWCVCGNDYATESKYSKVADSDCGSNRLGGPWRNAVFQIAGGTSYTHMPKGCVNGNNIVKYPNKSVEECKALCDQRSDCLAFEYGVAYGGRGGYKARDCQLQSSSNSANCDGSYHNLDLYVKSSTADTYAIARESFIYWATCPQTSWFCENTDYNMCVAEARTKCSASSDCVAVAVYRLSVGNYRHVIQYSDKACNDRQEYADRHWDIYKKNVCPWQKQHACTGSSWTDLDLNQEQCAAKCAVTASCNCVTWLHNNSKKCRLETGHPTNRNTDAYSALSMSTYATCYGIKNMGQNCWSHCNSSSGKCNWCGSGKCCRKGWKNGEKGCGAEEGADNFHACVADEFVAAPDTRWIGLPRVTGGTCSSGMMNLIDPYKNKGYLFVTFDDYDENCYEALIKPGECWGHQPENNNEYGCQGRCGGGCGGNVCSNWGPGCLSHDVCSYYFASTGGGSDRHCGDEYWWAAEQTTRLCFWPGRNSCELSHDSMSSSKSSAICH